MTVLRAGRSSDCALTVTYRSYWAAAGLVVVCHTTTESPYITVTRIKLARVAGENITSTFTIQFKYNLFRHSDESFRYTSTPCPREESNPT